MLCCLSPDALTVTFTTLRIDTPFRRKYGPDVQKMHAAAVIPVGNRVALVIGQVAGVGGNAGRWVRAT
jgi:hypothetical protein